jgi:DNA-binding CsgD family transcriptional regulator
MLEALDRSTQLGAARDMDRIRSGLRNHGVVLQHRRGRKGYGDQLSPREQDVVRLASTGKANREIAQALFLSPRTVEDHMSKAMRKLGINSRKDLIALDRTQEKVP